MIRLQLLGSVDLIGDDGLAIDAALRRSKMVVVLAYLAAARPRGFHRRDKIAALFWPELPADRARAALRVTLSRLRDSLGDEIVLTRGTDEIAIDAARLWCDVRALDEALAAGNPIAAAALYRGPLLDGVHIEGTAEELEHWIEAERARIENDLVQTLVAANDADAARKAIEIAPHDERPARQLIAIMLAAGDHVGALRTFDELARRLERQLGVEPSEETSTLVAMVRRSRAADSATAAPTRITLGSQPRGRDQAAGTLRQKILPGRYVAGGIAGVLLASAASLAVARSRAADAPPETSRRWSSVHVSTGLTPEGRIGPEALLDSTNDAVVVIGGMIYGEGPGDSRIKNDVRRLRGLHDTDLPEWQRLVVEGTPPPARWLFGLAYDAAHDRAILHGGARGFTSPCSNDTWLLTNVSGMGATPRWSKVRIVGESPSPRAGMRVVYDAAVRRLIFFGGHDCFTRFFNDVWVLTFTDSTLLAGRWTRLSPDTTEGVPVGRSAYAAMYDARLGRLVIEAGYAGGRTAGDTWMLEHANGDGVASWHRARCAGMAPTVSSPAAAYDSVGGNWVIFGGNDSLRVEQREVWRAIGMNTSPLRCTWERVAVADPLIAVRLGASAMINPATLDLVVYGGQYQSTAFRDVLVLGNPFRERTH